MRVLVLAPDRALETSICAVASDGGHDAAGEVLPQNMCSSLYRDPDALGVIRSTNSAFAAVTCRDFRRASVNNVLFVVIDDVEFHHGAVALILRCGADDVQPASMEPAEFRARLSALVRRGEYRDHLTINMPGCVFDAETGWAEGNGQRKRLTPSEGRLLSALAMEPERVLSKADLMDRLYGGEDEPEQKIVDVLVCKLRAKLLEMNGGLDVVETNWGRGYRFVQQGFEPRYREPRVRASR